MWINGETTDQNTDYTRRNSLGGCAVSFVLDVCVGVLDAHVKMKGKQSEVSS